MAPFYGLASLRRKPVKPDLDGADMQGQDDLDQFQQWFKASRDKRQKWAIETRICYDFVAGEQWTEDDSALMREQNRPIVTFNRVASVVDSVSGLEVANRQEVRFIPRQLGSAGVNELFTSAAKWVRDECQAEDEESDSFLDTIICGVGCTETRIDYDEDPDGKVSVLRVDPLEMFVDGSSKRSNFTDARHQFRVRQMSISDAEDLIPGFEPDELDATWATEAEWDATEPHDAQQAPFYRNDQSPDIDKQTRKITIVECQWWELEKGFRVLDPFSGQITQATAAEHSTLQKRTQSMGINLVSAPYKRRVYKKAFLGSKVLKVMDGPTEGGFTYKFITGKRDRKNGTWYGLVRAMIDPQKWANKWLAQIMHIMNTNAKGGIFAEADAFENPQQALDEWADPSSVTLVTSGALGSGKIKDKTQVAYPAGIAQLMEFAISSIRDVSGVNLELLGMAATDQPGIVEHQRKQAGMTILAGMFDALRQYRKEQGKLLLYYILNFLSDGRLVKIGGPQEAQYVPLIHQSGVVEYDVIVDDTPASANMKEQTWAAIMQLMPFLARLNLPPAVLLELLKESPLPISLVTQIQGMLKAQQQQALAHPQPNPMMIQAQARAQESQAKAQWHTAQAQAEQLKAQAQIGRTQVESELVQAEAFNQYAGGVANLAKANASGAGAQMENWEFLLKALQQSWENEQAQQQQALQAAQPATSTVQ